MLYGYPTACDSDKLSESELIFPRSSDEVLQIEKELGPVKMLIVVSEDKVFIYF